MGNYSEAGLQDAYGFGQKAFTNNAITGEHKMIKSFTWRIFISFGLFISFFMLLISGVILYVGPSGRGPGAIVWLIIGLTKPEWQNQHIIFGFTFSLFALFHLLLINWRAFLSYLKSKTKEGLKSPAELLFIIVLSLIFGIGTYFKIQPFSGILEFGKNISKLWDGKKPQQPGAPVRSEVLLKEPGKPG